MTSNFHLFLISQKSIILHHFFFFTITKYHLYFNTEPVYFVFSFHHKFIQDPPTPIHFCYNHQHFGFFCS